MAKGGIELTEPVGRLMMFSVLVPVSSVSFGLQIEWNWKTDLTLAKGRVERSLAVRDISVGGYAG